jgi:hypothetical protein
MFCYNETSSTLGFTFDPTLKGGKCALSYCNMSTYYDSIEDSNDGLQARMFMVGQGPSFYSADRANLYCNYTMQLSVKWMVGRNGPPEIPAGTRAARCLERNILPLYIYYTDGTFIDPVRTGEIAANLSTAGPVMITTELAYDSSDANTLARVKGQIIAIKQNCPKCMSVLAVKSGDEDGVKKILYDQQAYLNGRNLSNLTDVIGFGFRANDYQNCSVDKIFLDNYAFSRHVLSYYSKPTIWLYAGASEGNSSDGSCQFSNESVHRFYQNVFSSIQGMASSGILGVGFYEFGDRGGSLPCNGIQGCDFGVTYMNGTQKHPEINTWSDLCQKYGATSRSPLVFSRNAQGPACDFAQDWIMQRYVSQEVNSQRGLSAAEVGEAEPEKLFGCGALCVSETSLPNRGAYGVYGTAFDESFCSAYPFMDDRADDFDVSQAYFRSIVAVESGFNHTAVSCVNDTNMACNPDNRTMAQICADSGNPASCPSDFTCGPGFKPCGFGLSQCTEYPGQYYSANGQEMPGTIENCGAAAYNPFDPAQSVCCGTGKFSSFLSTARRFIYNNWGVLSACDNGLKGEDREWATYFLASAYYNAGTATVPRILNFTSQRDHGGQCTGEQNYINFLRNRGFRSYGSYASDVMSKYLAAVSKCGIDCPS